MIGLGPEPTVIGKAYRTKGKLKLVPMWNAGEVAPSPGCQSSSCQWARRAEGAVEAPRTDSLETRGRSIGRKPSLQQLNLVVASTRN